ncbi:MAG: NAD(P)H-hydrate dehydratase [Bacteroidota bacterium]|nr:NAD(P)H-hydrate dehydratase [Bacteroidota bacterium]
MEPVVTGKEMRECDRIAIEDIGISGIILMENAGRGIVDEVEKKYGALSDKRFLILCGKGNNGGDGFVVARHLFNRGSQVNVVLLGKASGLKGDAQSNYKIFEEIVKREKSKNNAKFIKFKNLTDFNKISDVDFIVDAIFGTGFTGKVIGIYKEVIEFINSVDVPKIAIDIPSGVNADNGDVANVAVSADMVVTMGLRKIGLTLGKSINYIKDLKVVDISIPRFVIDNSRFKTFTIDEEDIRTILPRRSKTVHKYNLGKIFILAGSKGYTGAAAMAAQSAMRMGAGAVILGTPETVYPILAKKLTEVMVNPLDATDEGTVGLNAFNQIKKFIGWASHLVIGCGLSLNEETEKVVSKILLGFDKPMLIDADGLTILSKNPALIKNRKSKYFILTPHTGEFARLTGLSVDEIEKDKINIAREFARKNKLTLVLKDAPTITASADGRVIINSTGNAGMATAGSGDVLAGIIGGLWAQGMTDFEAAYAGVFLHGLAGDIAKEKLGERSLMALDIQHQIPQAIKSVTDREL